MPVILDKSSDPVLIEKFIWIGSKKLETYLDIGKNQRVTIREELPAGLYWTKVGRKIFWNWYLVRDWFLNGGDRTTPEHQQLVEEYIQTLPNPKSA